MQKDSLFARFMTKVREYVLGLFGRKSLTQNQEEKEEEIFLEPVKEFYEAYIGVSITGFETYFEDVKDIENKVVAKMITDAKVKGEDLYLELSGLTGRHGGYLKISPSGKGQFAERINLEEPTSFSRYRINFYGGDCIEYIDSDELGMISYHDGFIR